MKYITEEELRDLCNVQAFETFTLMEGVKLTPGGRQFLVDRKIPIIVQGEQKATKTISISADGREEQPNKQSCNNKDQCLQANFALIEAIFFRQVMELLEKNQALANQVYDIKCCIESIACNNGKTMAACEATTEEELVHPHKECFQIEREVMFAEHGKEAAVLHLLRCELQKFYFDNEDILKADQKKELLCLTNGLSGMIRSLLGKDHCTGGKQQF